MLRFGRAVFGGVPQRQQLAPIRQDDGIIEPVNHAIQPVPVRGRKVSAAWTKKKPTFKKSTFKKERLRLTPRILVRSDWHLSPSS